MYWIKAKIITIAITKIFTSCALDVQLDTFTYQQFPQNKDKQLPRHYGFANKRIYFAHHTEGEPILSLVASDNNGRTKFN